MTAAGLVVGLVASSWATKLVASQLYQVGRLDPLAFAAAPLVLLAVAVAASSLPAWRAARANPVAALRQD
jgi:ABC-type lipoprotein release transport system permease subunit